MGVHVVVVVASVYVTRSATRVGTDYGAINFHTTHPPGDSLSGESSRLWSWFDQKNAVDAVFSDLTIARDEEFPFSFTPRKMPWTEGLRSSVGIAARPVALAAIAGSVYIYVSFQR